MACISAKKLARRLKNGQFSHFPKTMENVRNKFNAGDRETYQSCCWVFSTSFTKHDIFAVLGDFSIKTLFLHGSVFDKSLFMRVCNDQYELKEYIFSCRA